MDDLDRFAAERTKKNTDFPAMVAAEERRLELIARLVAIRRRRHLSQTEVARVMNVSQSVVADIESGAVDIRYTTLDRYAEAVSGGRARLTIGRTAAAGRI